MIGISSCGWRGNVWISGRLELTGNIIGDSDYHLGTVEHGDDDPSERVDFDFVCALFECLPKLLRRGHLSPVV